MSDKRSLLGNEYQSWTPGFFDQIPLGAYGVDTGKLKQDIVNYRGNRDRVPKPKVSDYLAGDEYGDEHLFLNWLLEEYLQKSPGGDRYGMNPPRPEDEIDDLVKKFGRGKNI